MSGISNYLAGKQAALEFNGTAFTEPSTVYFALLTCTNGPLARSTAYALNNTVSFVAADGQNHLYKCTTAGTTAASAPAYPGYANEVITDGTAVFTEQTSALQAGTAMVEPSGNGYARVSEAMTSGNWTVSNHTITNAAAINFPTPTGPWQTSPVEFWGFATYDAATVGNLLRFGGLTSDQIINTGNTVSFAIGAVTFKTDAG